MSADKATSNGSMNGESPSFEELTARLEEILQLLERGDLPLDAALDAYERGVVLVRESNELLDRAELRITELSQSVEESAPSRRAQSGFDGSLFDFGRDDE